MQRCGHEDAAAASAGKRSARDILLSVTRALIVRYNPVRYTSVYRSRAQDERAAGVASGMRKERYLQLLKFVTERRNILLRPRDNRGRHVNGATAAARPTT